MNKNRTEQNRTEQDSYKRYGKSSAALLNLKTSFFEKNELHLKKQRQIASIYKKQKKRISCKNCNVKINATHDFIKNGIEYTLCENCNHLNGVYEIGWKTFWFQLRWVVLGIRPPNPL
ncbi:MAG: hypothetical protein U9P79_06050 [Candidatus Cloacimonadota bacterium]|nr:hypothetical protein [Candidatus Cloacimonadota bacterium]